MRTTRAFAGAALVVALGLAAGCGGGGGLDTGVSHEAEGQLVLQVAAVRQSAEAGDLAHANGYLDELVASVPNLQSQGKLDDAAGARILAAAEAVRRELDASTPTTEATTTTTAPPPPDTAPPREHKKKGKDD
jgi:hypothetical protein